MRGLAVSAFLLLGLVGCASLTPAERRAADEAQCRDYGFRPGTDAFAACLQRIDLSRDADRRARFDDDAFLARPTVIYSPVLVR